MSSVLQPSLFDLEKTAEKKTREILNSEQSGTFSPNMKLPVHRWFRYSAGFSAEWVGSIFKDYSPTRVLDPFVGSGTVCIESDKAGISSYGVESHPFVFRLAQGKISWGANIDDFKQAISEIEDRARLDTDKISGKTPQLLAKCYTESNLTDLFRLRKAYSSVAKKLPDELQSLVFLAINAILRPSSHAGTAQWQYVLPNKRKISVTKPSDALTAQALLMASDMAYMQRTQKKSLSLLVQSDARTLTGIPNGSIDLVVTSPPYANNYDYADATRLEMTFWQEIDAWGDLHEVVRKHLLCSSSQHASKERLELEDLLNNPIIDPIRKELSDVCHELAIVRNSKGGKKAYHTMLAAYFSGMAQTFIALRRVTTSNCNLCLVIGDSAPYGVHAPVERWFGELAMAVGFKGWSFEKIRDRNIKWKNRKHTVPLKEGRLWIKG
jgi:DNA modification methylase